MRSAVVVAALLAASSTVSAQEFQFTQIDVPGARFTRPFGVNASGRPAVAVRGQHAPTVAHGMNDLGDLVGRCFDAGGKELAWLWRHDGAFVILDSPDFLTTDAWIASTRDLVAGDYSDTSHFVHGYVWTEESGIVTLDFPGNQTGIRGVNERGDVTGVYASVGTREHGFLLRDASSPRLITPGASTTRAPS